MRSAILLVCVGLGCPPAAADELGRALFAGCRACHPLDPTAQGMAGPNLSGLLGRRIAGDQNFDYSPAFKQARASNQIWTRERLDAFLADPEAMFPGMWMTARAIADPVERNALVGFLADPKAR